MLSRNRVVRIARVIGARAIVGVAALSAIFASAWLIAHPVGEKAASLAALREAISIQLVLGILPITGAAIAAQIAALSVGPFATRATHLPRRVAPPLLLTIASLMLDVTLIGANADATAAQAALIIALLTLGVSLLYTRSLIDLASPDGILRDALQELTPSWWRTEISTRPVRFAPTKVHRITDAFLVVDRLLQQSMARSDSVTFGVVLARLRDQLERSLTESRPPVGPGERYEGPSEEDEARLESWLLERWRGLIEQAEHDHRGWALQAFLTFRLWCMPRIVRHDESFKLVRPHLALDLDGATSSHLLLALLHAAVRARLASAIDTGIAYLFYYLSRIVNDLPLPEEVGDLVSPPKESGARYPTMWIAWNELCEGIGSLALSAVVGASPRVAEKIAEMTWHVFDELRRAAREPIWLERLGVPLLGRLAEAVERAAEHGVCLIRLFPPPVYGAESSVNRAAARVAARELGRQVVIGFGALDTSALGYSEAFAESVQAYPEAVGELRSGLAHTARLADKSRPELRAALRQTLRRLDEVRKKSSGRRPR